MIFKFDFLPWGHMYDGFCFLLLVRSAAHLDSIVGAVMILRVALEDVRCIADDALIGRIVLAGASFPENSAAHLDDIVGPVVIVQVAIEDVRYIADDALS